MHRTRFTALYITRNIFKHFWRKGLFLGDFTHFDRKLKTKKLHAETIFQFSALNLSVEFFRHVSFVYHVFIISGYNENLQKKMQLQLLCILRHCFPGPQMRLLQIIAKNKKRIYVIFSFILLAPSLLVCALVHVSKIFPVFHELGGQIFVEFIAQMSYNR